MSATPQTAAVPSPNTDSDASMLLSRTVLVEFSASPVTFATQNCARWSIAESTAAKIFARDATTPSNTGNIILETYCAAVELNVCLLGTQEIKNVLLKKVTMLEHKTNIPHVTSLKIDNLPGNEYTQTGNSSSMHFLGEGNEHSPVYVCPLDVKSSPLTLRFNGGFLPIQEALIFHTTCLRHQGTQSLEYSGCNNIPITIKTISVPFRS